MPNYRGISPEVNGGADLGSATQRWNKLYANELDLISNNKAAQHNSIFRGKDLTEYFNSGDMSVAIANGSFDNIYPGDYILKSITVDGTTYADVLWLVGDLNYHLGCGSPKLSTNHVLMIAKDCIASAPMNDSATTSGGYVGSKMWTVTIPKYVTAIKNAFGEDHVLAHKEILTSSVNDTAASGAGYGTVGSANNWASTTVYVNIPNEPMVYGGRVFSSSARDVGDCMTQIAAFRHSKAVATPNTYMWLRSVSTSSAFCYFDPDGTAANASATGGSSVRPYFLLV